MPLFRAHLLQRLRPPGSPLLMTKFTLQPHEVADLFPKARKRRRPSSHDGQ